MRSATITAILAVFMAVALAPDNARADGEADTSNSDYHFEGACDTWARISTRDATCLSSGHGFAWDGRGSYAWARNECSNYGAIVAHRDVVIDIDGHFHLSHGNKSEFARASTETRDITCCINESDLCYKDQIEPIESGEWAGHIRYINVNASSYDVGLVDVRTHEQRYEFCSTFPEQIYCDEDPEGDAHVLPASQMQDPNTMTRRDLRARPCGGEDEPVCGCGDRRCDRFDCEKNFSLSPAALSCFGWYLNSETAGDAFTHVEPYRWRCEAEMHCRVSNHEYKDASFTGSHWDLKALNNCGGVLQTDDCGDVAITTDNCRAAFNESPAAASCTNLRAGKGTIMNSQMTWTGLSYCGVNAECGGRQHSLQIYSVAKTREVQFCSSSNALRVEC